MEKLPTIKKNNYSSGICISRNKGRNCLTKKLDFKYENDVLKINDLQDGVYRELYIKLNVDVTENPLGYKISEQKEDLGRLTDPIEPITSIILETKDTVRLENVNVDDVLFILEGCIEKYKDIYLTKNEAIKALQSMEPIIYYMPLTNSDLGRLDISMYTKYGFKCQAIGIIPNNTSDTNPQIQAMCLLQFYLSKVI